MSPTWKPWTLDEVEDLITREARELTSENRDLWLSVRIRPELARAESGPGSDGQSYWAVARRDRLVLYWDGIEEQFGTAEEQGGVLTAARTHSENLAWALEALAKRA